LLRRKSTTSGVSTAPQPGVGTLTVGGTVEICACAATPELAPVAVAV
jgi:hypothetical protein